MGERVGETGSCPGAFWVQVALIPAPHFLDPSWVSSTRAGPAGQARGLGPWGPGALCEPGLRGLKGLGEGRCEALPQGFGVEVPHGGTSLLGSRNPGLQDRTVLVILGHVTPSYTPSFVVWSPWLPNGPASMLTYP